MMTPDERLREWAGTWKNQGMGEDPQSKALEAGASALAITREIAKQARWREADGYYGFQCVYCGVDEDDKVPHKPECLYFRAVQLHQGEKE